MGLLTFTILHRNAFWHLPAWHEGEQAVERQERHKANFFLIEV